MTSNQATVCTHQAAQHEDVCTLLKKLRDRLPQPPAGAARAPDIVRLVQGGGWSTVTPLEGVAAGVKGMVNVLLHAGRRL